MTNPDRDALVRDLLSASSGSRELSDRVLLAVGHLKDAVGIWRNSSGQILAIIYGHLPDPTRDLQDCADVCPLPIGCSMDLDTNGDFITWPANRDTYCEAHGQHAEARSRCAVAVDGKAKPCVQTAV